MSCARSAQTSPKTPSSFPVGNARRQFLLSQVLRRQVLRRRVFRRRVLRRQALSCPPLPCGVGRGDGSLVSQRMTGVLEGHRFIQRPRGRRSLRRRSLRRSSLRRSSPSDCHSARSAQARLAQASSAPTNLVLKNMARLSTAIVHARSNSVRASPISLWRAPLRRVRRRRARGWHAAVRARPRACEVGQPV
jgi:hypothetical protein